MFIALVVGVLGTLVGSAIAGVDPVWNVSAIHFTLIVLGSVLGMLFGFMIDPFRPKRNACRSHEQHRGVPL